MFSTNRVDAKLPTRHSGSFLRWVLFDSIRQAADYLNLCFEVKQERADLAKVTDSELRDMGIHPADAAAERRKSFFDVPAERQNFYSPEEDK